MAFYQKVFRNLKLELIKFVNNIDGYRDGNPVLIIKN